MLVTEAHVFKIQIGIRSESDCFLGQFRRIFVIYYQHFSHYGSPLFA